MPVDTRLGGEANRIRWIQYWIDNPEEATERWWSAEYSLLRQQANEYRKANKPKPYTKERKTDVCNKSGLPGVTWYPKYNKWRSQIGIRPIVVSLGYFDTKEQAHEAYLKAREIYKAFKRGEIEKDVAIATIKQRL